MKVLKLQNYLFKLGQKLEEDTPIYSIKANRIVNILFNKNFTKFDIYDYITQSKKSRRSQRVVKRVKTVLQYQFCGICLSFKNKAINSSILCRNVIELFPIEFTIPIFSPWVTSYWESDIYKRKICRNRAYYLRKKVATAAKFSFDYVLD
jgi:ribosomal protein L19